MNCNKKSHFDGVTPLSVVSLDVLLCREEALLSHRHELDVKWFRK